MRNVTSNENRNHRKNYQLECNNKMDNYYHKNLDQKIIKIITLNYKNKTSGFTDDINT